MKWRSISADFTHFVWLRNARGDFDPQLWTEDLTVTMPASGTKYRGDCMRPIAERVAFKVELPSDIGAVTLDSCIRMWPAPVRT